MNTTKLKKLAALQPLHYFEKYNHPNGAQVWVRNVNQRQSKIDE